MDQRQLNGVTRHRLLRAALQRFAHAGYAATSVRQIVDAARLTKPVLYYYFPDKAGLFQALVSEALDERYRLMQEAAARAARVRGQLVEILDVLFDYIRQNRELMRLSLATAFASPGEVPAGLQYADKCERNFEFLHGLIKRGVRRGELARRFTSRELAFGFYGQVNAYLLTHLLLPKSPLTRQTAERIVDLFLAGAGAKGPRTTCGTAPATGDLATRPSHQPMGRGCAKDRRRDVQATKAFPILEVEASRGQKRTTKKRNGL